mmetsp:Transcript_8858/g.36670  ORF Transcript_8858/g.36670 Transcript_8858/m.36670 type:complete len:227 (+) Transcript_8858:38-718(+)
MAEKEEKELSEAMAAVSVAERKEEESRPDAGANEAAVEADGKEEKATDVGKAENATGGNTEAEEELNEEELWKEVEKMVRGVVQTWTVVQMAVERMWGGTHTAEKVEDMILAVLDSLSNPKKADLDELLAFLDDFVLRGLNVVAEDGSVEEVALLIWDLYCDIGNGDLSTTRAMQARLSDEQAAKVHAQMHPEEQVVIPKQPKQPKQEPVVDDDGWETVTRKPRRK